MESEAVNANVDMTLDDEAAEMAGLRECEAKVHLEKLKGEIGQQTYDQHFAGQPPKRVVLRKIELCRELFQPRAEEEAHVKDLMDGLKIHGELDPLLVLWTPQRVVLIDGHHRWTALWRAGWADKAVTVKWFDGTVEEAVAESLRANTQAKLPMTMQQRQDAAWRLVRLGVYTRPEMVAAAGVSDGQLGIMKRLFRDFRETVIAVDSWFKAKKAARGHADWTLPTEDEREIELAARARSYADRMRKAFRDTLARNSDMFARMLSFYCGRNLARLKVSIEERLVEEGWEPDPSDNDDF
jgi:ParB-like nuclease domain